MNYFLYVTLTVLFLIVLDFKDFGAELDTYSNKYLSTNVLSNRLQDFSYLITINNYHIIYKWLSAQSLIIQEIIII